MTQKTRVQIADGLAYLIEDAIERFEPVMAATAISDKLQKMLEDLGKILPDDIMPMQDKLSKHFGPEVATKFTQTATEQVSQAIAALTSTKMALDGEIKRLEKGVDGGDMSDMSQDAEAMPAPSMAPPGAPEAPSGMGGMPGAPEGAPPEAGMPDMPGAEMAGNAEDDMAGGFAGRPQKEGVKPRGKNLKEFVDAPVRPAHPYKGDYFHGNLDNLKNFHGGLGRLARNIEQMIDSGKLNGAEREGLANTLSHMASTGHDAGHWVDPEAKLTTSLKANHITNTDDPNVALILHELRRLAHGLSLRHSSVMEHSISALRKASDPDALVFRTFRTKLAESRDAQMAAIRTARQFAIDIDDVVLVVREAAKKLPFADWIKQKKDDKKKDDGKKEEKKPVSEDFPPPNAGQQSGVPIFPVGQTAPANATAAMASAVSTSAQNPVMSGEPDWNSGNQSNSTRKPLSPGDKKAAVTQQNMASLNSQQPQQPQAQSTSPVPAKQNQDQPNFDQKRRKMMAGTGTSPQPNIR